MRGGSSLSRGLGARESGFELPHGHGLSSVRQFLLRKSERIGCLQSRLSQQTRKISLTVNGL